MNGCSLKTDTIFDRGRKLPCKRSKGTQNIGSLVACSGMCAEDSTIGHLQSA